MVGTNILSRLSSILMSRFFIHLRIVVDSKPYGMSHDTFQATSFSQYSQPPSVARASVLAMLDPLDVRIDPELESEDPVGLVASGSNVETRSIVYDSLYRHPRGTDISHV